MVLFLNAMHISAVHVCFYNFVCQTAKWNCHKLWRDSKKESSAMKSWRNGWKIGQNTLLSLLLSCVDSYVFASTKSWKQFGCRELSMRRVFKVLCIISLSVLLFSAVCQGGLYTQWWIGVSYQDFSKTQVDINVFL